MGVDKSVVADLLEPTDPSGVLIFTEEYGQREKKEVVC